jgi:predicted transcriptional regulator
MRNDKILVSLDREIGEKLREYAKEENRSMTYVIESAVVYFLGIKSTARAKWLLPVNREKETTST